MQNACLPVTHMELATLTEDLSRLLHFEKLLWSGVGEAGVIAQGENLQTSPSPFCSHTDQPEVKSAFEATSQQSFVCEQDAAEAILIVLTSNAPADHFGRHLHLVRYQCRNSRP